MGLGNDTHNWISFTIKVRDIDYTDFRWVFYDRQRNEYTREDDLKDYIEGYIDGHTGLLGEIDAPHLYDMSIATLKRHSDLMAESVLFDIDNDIITIEDSHSQLYQDLWVIDMMKYKHEGLFVDIGANDGVTFSNSYLLEKSFGWKGLLIEAQQKHFRALYTTRDAVIIPYCVFNQSAIMNFVQVFEELVNTEKSFDYDMLSGLTETRDNLRVSNEMKNHVKYRWKNIEMPCIHIQHVLDDHEMKYIDYLSIDTEGADMAILRAINFERVDIAIIHGEFRYYDERAEVYNFLSKLGYIGRPLGHDMCFWREDLVQMHKNKTYGLEIKGNSILAES